MTDQADEASRSAATGRLLRAAPRETLEVVADLAGRLLGATSAEVALLTDVRHTVTAVGEAASRRGTTMARADALCDVVVRQRAPLVVTDAHRDDRVRDLGAVRAGMLGSYLGVPMVADDGHVVGSLCVHQQGPRGWSEHDTRTLRELAAIATGHLEVAALAEEYRDTQRAAALEGAAHAAGIGTWDYDVTTGGLVWDDVLLDLFGLTPATFGGTVDWFFGAVHPADRDHLAEVVAASVRDASLYEAEFRILRPDGSTRWVVARGRPLTDAAGRTVRMVGAVTDVTAVREGEERLGAVLETMAVGYVAVDRDWRFTYVNTEAERVLGPTRAGLLGRSLWEAFPAAVGTELEQRYRSVAETGREVSFDTHYPAPLDAWFEVRAVPTRDGVGIYFLDITERRAAQAAAEANRDRATVLARVASSFTENPDVEDALVEAARTLVPRYADWVVASVFDDGPADWRTRLRDVGAVHRDPARAGLLEEYRRARAGAWSASSAARAVLLEGRPTRLQHSDPSVIGRQLLTGRAHDLLRELAPDSTLVLPLLGRGRTRGLLTLVRGAGRPPFGDEEVTELEDLTRQIGLGLDNGRLHAEQRGLAEELQLSLLTELPQPDHLHLVTRYVAAADGAQVGGDWYDGFLTGDGRTCLVIGDVTGHDRGAAAAMAQVRNVLRGIAHALDGPPSRVLRALDRAVHDLAVGTLGTAVLAQLEQTPADRAAGRRVLRWSNAGHLPPLLLRADGTAELLDRPADLLLGLAPGTGRSDHSAVLHDGDTVVLYTDGLVERRGEDLDEGLERLRRTVADLAGRDPDELCDELLERLSDGREDDVALLVLRLHPQGVTRPAGAGPALLPEDLAGEV